MIIVTGSIQARLDTIDELRRLSIEHVTRSRAEPGCLEHGVTVDVNDGLRLVHAAEPQQLPSSPNPKLALQVASALGLLAGIGLSLLAARRRRPAPAPKPAVREGRPAPIPQYEPHPDSDAVSLP